MTNWYGLLAPSATPRETIARIHQEVARVLNLPDLKQRLADDGMTVVASTPEAFTQFLQRETAKYNRVIDAAGIKGSM
jgi:tripartite-type tricarboxylate transporter receptor subunit TctC